MQTKLQELKNRLIEINNLSCAAAVLQWDQATYMPPGGAAARGRQMATLEKLAHEKFIDPAIGKLLNELRSYEESLPYDHDDAALIRVARREYERAVKVPADFTAEFSNHCSATYQAWTKARPANDFATLRPMLEKTLEYRKRLADFFPGYEHPLDPLIDYADYGMKTSTVRAIFTDLRKQLVPIAQAITSQAVADDSCLRKKYPIEKQFEFGLDVIKRYGYDFHRGRQDKTHHPFMTKFSLGDVRITTRADENFLGQALFGTLHEAGHALYEQNISMAYEGTPLASGTSIGVHESQSRTWENLVGRSKPFWNYFYPKLQQMFPEQLSNVAFDTFYRAINKVQRGLIRVEADEVTYNLHVMIRFDFEMQLLEGSLALKDVPEAWHARYQSDIGVRAPDDKDGVLQDVHWYHGMLGGYFQGYTLGNIMSAQFFNAALKAKPQIAGEISEGKFDTLRGWLTENIYQHGSKFTAEEILQRATGQKLTIEPYINYLRTKYGELYKLT